MSRDATNWAWQTKPGSSSCKLVLLSMADRADENNRCFPSAARLIDDTNLDRKTVLKSISTLEENGFITDTKERRGHTKSIRVFRLNFEVLEAKEKPKQSQKRNSPKSGTATPLKQSQISLEAIPNFPLSDPNFPMKQSQKRDTESTGINRESTGNQKIYKKDSPKTKPEPDFSSWLALGDIPESLINDWLEMRKMRRAVVSQFVIDGAVKEFAIVMNATGMTVADCIVEWLTRNWQGFKSEWVLNSRQRQPVANDNSHAIADFLSELGGELAPHANQPGVYDHES